MKSLITVTLAAILFNLPAQAAYNCESADGSTLKVFKQIHHFGNTLVLLKSEDQEITFYGHKTEEGDIYKKEVVTFGSATVSGDLSDDSLTITHSPKQCGRGSCVGDGGENIWAQLVFNGAETYFSCNETQ